MPIFLILLGLFFLVPLVEIFVLIEVGSQIGTLSTIALVVFTAVLGAWLMRWQGFQTLRRVQSASERGEIPAVEMLEGVAILVAGGLLLTPGFVTDAFGFVLLTPALRRGLILSGLAASVANLRRGSASGAHHRGGPKVGVVIDGEFEENSDSAVVVQTSKLSHRDDRGGR